MKTLFSSLFLVCAGFSRAAVGDLDFEVTSPVSTNFLPLVNWGIQTLRPNVWQTITNIAPTSLSATQALGTFSIFGLPLGSNYFRAFARATNGVGPFSAIAATNIVVPSLLIQVDVQDADSPAGPWVSRTKFMVPPIPRTNLSRVVRAVLTAQP